MGQSFEDVMPAFWKTYGQTLLSVKNGQTGVARNELEIPLQRHGYLEETWWDGGFVSLKDHHGSYGGVYLSLVEVTKSTVRNRRTAIVNRLGQSSLVQSNLVWQHIHRIFSSCSRDVTMAIMYGADDSKPDVQRICLKHSIGLNDAYEAAPYELDVSCSTPATLPSSKVALQYHMVCHLQQTLLLQCSVWIRARRSASLQTQMISLLTCQPSSLLRPTTRLLLGPYSIEL